VRTTTNSARLAALGELCTNRALRRAELAWGGFHAAEWGSLVALSVVAYEADGAEAVGLVLFARMVPSALVAPFVAVIGDRYRRERILLAVHLIRGVACLAAAAALALDAPPIAVYVSAVLAAVPLAAHRPCHLALVPLLARSPRELSASNVAALSLESAAVLAGPLAAAALLAVSEPAAVFAACAAISFLSFAAIAGIRAGAPSTRAGARPGVLRELREGLRALAHNRPVRLVVALFGAQAFVRGALGVLVVVVAIDVLGIGEPGVGLLMAAFGVGGVAGALGGISLVGRGALGRPFQVALAGWGLPLAVIGLWPETGVALVALAASGFANSLLDVAGFTSMQEHVDERLLGRVFGLFELVVIVSVAAGSLAAPALLDLLGSRGALIAVGALLPLLAALAHRQLGNIDEGMAVRADELELLRRTVVFAPLSYAALRRLASSLGEQRAPAGEVIVRQGDDGDVVYVIREGRVAVSRNGAAVAELGPDDTFGEAALILDAPRNATVTALEPVLLRTLGRGPFLAEVTGNRLSKDALDRLVAARDPAAG
jgi:predicted MFS family arabinose efflux permease